MILSEVWGYSFDPGSNVVDVLVFRLREKIDRGFDPPLLHTARGRHLVRVSMASLEAELDPAVFVRAHRAAIVNLDAVQELSTRDDSCLRLVDGTRVPVSRSRRRHVEAAIGARG